MLTRDGDGTGRRYRNTPETAAFLDKSSPTYIGGVLEMCNARLYRFWGDLTEALQTGQPQNEVKHTGRPMFDELYSDPARLQQFMNAMTGASMSGFHALAEAFDFSKYQTVCDVGGATGQLAVILARRHRAPALHHLRPAGGRTAGPADHRSRRTRRPGHHRLRGLLHRPASRGGRDHDGHDPARLEPRTEAAAHPGRLRRAATRRRVHRHRTADRRRPPHRRLRPARCR